MYITEILLNVAWSNLAVTLKAISTLIGYYFPSKKKEKIKIEEKKRKNAPYGYAIYYTLSPTSYADKQLQAQAEYTWLKWWGYFEN